MSLVPGAPSTITPRCSTWLDLQNGGAGIVQFSIPPTATDRYLSVIRMPAVPALAGLSIIAQSLWFPTPSIDGFDLSTALRVRFGH